jgi:two-component system cell cycle sensor histidine kinase/response regulator CckA
VHQADRIAALPARVTPLGSPLGKHVTWLAMSVGTLVAGTVTLALSLAVPGPRVTLALGLMSAILFGVGLLLGTRAVLRHLRRQVARDLAIALSWDDPSPVVLANDRGQVLARNPASWTGRDWPDGVAASLLAHLPDAEVVVGRLSRAVAESGSAAVIVPTPRGPLRVAARRAGRKLVAWRLHPVDPFDYPEAELPEVVLGSAGEILSTNAAFARVLGPPPASLDTLVLDPPFLSGRVHRFAAASGPLEQLAILRQAQRGGRQLLLLPPPEPEPRAAAGRWDAIEALPVPLLRVSPAGIVLAANASARALLPHPLSPDTRLSDLLDGLGRPVAEWVADVAEGRPNTGPQFLRGTRENQDTVLRVSLVPAGSPADPHLIAVLDDVTELKALEAQFVQSQKMQALGQLAGGVAHDFNNLLTAISGHCDLLLLRHMQGDPEYSDLVQIRQNVNRAAALVGQLLAFSRKQSMIPETLDLRAVLLDLTHLLDRLVGERTRLTLHHGPSLRYIRADKRQLEQVIMNLIVNARDAMPNGGEVRIETTNLHLDEPIVQGRATVPVGGYVLVKVIDEGTGIPPERLPKIFDPFYTTKKPGEGTGLGLSTVYGIIKQTGGYIFVDSEVGRGTTFTLWFPAHDKPPEPEPAPAPREAPLSQRLPGRILLVEDEAPVRAFAVRALRMRGHEVLEADCGTAALELFAGLKEPPDVILTDVILPDMDGPSWVRSALSGRPGPRVVFMSGYAESAFGEQKAMIEGSVFLPKPFSLAELTAVVERELDIAAGVEPPAPLS